MTSSGRPLRVVLLHNIISPHVVPLFDLLARQPGIALKVYFLAETDRNRRWATGINASFEYQILRNWAIRVGRKDLNTFFINPGIAATLLRDKPDVVISVGWDSFAAQASFVLCKLLRWPYVLWSGSTANEPSWRRTLTLPIVRTMVAGADAWIAYGSRARDYLVALGATANKVAIAFNTVDVAWFARTADELRSKRAEVRADLNLGSGSVVLYVGQLIERKGALDLLEAHRLLLRGCPDAKLLLAGYGPLESVLRRKVSSEHIDGVHFLGHVKISDLPRYYVASDVFTLPSHEEVWGLVLNEAAACGLPLVTTAPVGAAPDLVISGRNGFVVPAREPASLAGALQQALSASDAFGRESRAIVSGMTYEQNVGAILNAVHEAARRPAG